MEETLWKYVEKLCGGKDTSGLRKFKCNFCCKEFGGSYTRVRGHILGLKSAGIGSCTKITIAERARARCEDEEHMSKKMKAANQPSASTLQQRQLHSAFNIATREEVDEAVARCFYANGLSFNVARSPSFVSMVSAISAFGRGYKPPTSEKIRTTLLKRERSKVEASLSSIRASWSHTGCSIISDGWTDTAHRPLINIMVSSPRGSVFLRAVDASGEVKSSDWISNHLKDAIMEVGSSNVVQVITDSAANCVAAGEKVNAEFPWIFWTPCTAHCLNLLMKDLTKNAWINEVIEQGKTIQQFVCNHEMSRAMLMKNTELKLIKPVETRFATYFLMLQRLVSTKDALRMMVVSGEWEKWREHSKGDGPLVQQLLIGSEFWNKAEKLVTICEPIVKVLRMVDGDDPCLGEVYEALDQMLEGIKVLLNDDDQYEEIQFLTLERWDMLHSPLHAAAYLLNPKWWGKGQESDAEVMRGWRKTIGACAKSENERITLMSELSMYLGEEGVFGDEDARKMRNGILSPIAWWENFGSDTPSLQRLAIRLLSQVSSSSSSERNWSTYSFIHSKRRNGLTSERAEDLVFVHSNLRLTSRKTKEYKEGESSKWDVDVDVDDLVEEQV